MMRRKRLFFIAIIMSGMAQAADLDDVLKSSEQKLQAAQSSQQKIDGLAEKTQDIVEDYREASKIVDDLKVYNRKLEIQIDKQSQKIQRIEQSIANVKVIQRQIMPQIIKMVDALEDFIKLDVPFHQQEREQRIGFLRANIDRPDLSVAEKFRQVLEAYKIENEYGRKIDTYIATVPIAGVEREVSILRVGRIALLYQTSDKEHSGMWDGQSRQWVALDQGEYQEAIRKGLRIAKKQASIDILELPVAAPEAVQ